jgi:hypothetical protein
VSSVEVDESLVKLGRSKIRPENVRKVVLRIGALPDKIVRESQLAAGTYNKVHIGDTLGVKLICD